MSCLIGLYQNAFVPGQLLGDGFLMANEIIHYIKSNRRGPLVAALKFDLNKTYDRLKWDFIEAVLRQVCFLELWISIIMKCMTTASYSILINGKP